MKKRPWLFLLIVMGTSSSAWSWAMNDKLLNETRNGIHDPAKALLQEAKINETKAAKAMQEVAQLVPSDEEERLANYLNKEGLALFNAGKYSEAKVPHLRTLAIWEKVLGPEHPNVATSLDNLALLYDLQGRYEKAEPLYLRALAIREKVLGPEHPDVATSLNNLALLYDVQGHYEKAEPFYQRSLAIREKVLGPEHSHVAASLNNLAAHYNAQGRLEEAKPLNRRAQAIWEKVFMPAHQNGVIVGENHALLLEEIQQQNKVQAAAGK